MMSEDSLTVTRSSRSASRAEKMKPRDASRGPVSALQWSVVMKTVSLRSQ